MPKLDIIWFFEILDEFYHLLANLDNITARLDSDVNFLKIFLLPIYSQYKFDLLLPILIKSTKPYKILYCIVNGMKSQSPTSFIKHPTDLYFLQFFSASQKILFTAFSQSSVINILRVHTHSLH